MFKVERYGNGYKVSVGIGRATRASSVEEVATMLKHYYGKPHSKTNCRFCKETR